ncbi:hypothetical protein A3D03_00900 [Candidatus Gottesmanbacteria bacterium RIFCSPHIGHO2_02_FULL_40_13]|uniref:Glycosyltransferase RgtA/B/C/D-like domain-containing protein n=1 Tax=Candidatus Gottesmanbacteria bacterium RIFCSPHIGHO2_02_FULL_40_13 TaxID=1798384 RepID=A0A1F6A7W0_9BACT|nr:MAG: hypothetical protein A3D03_00900 [Candidatus Gottesmanbacteria bacterium RIFCSPHIGHO2_02_FULL_40_13]
MKQKTTAPIFMKLKPALFWIVTFLPLIILTILIFKYYVGVPFWDEWDFVGLLQKSYLSKVNFSDFSSYHNEHRPFFPRLILLGLAYLTGYRILPELILNLLLAIGIFISLFYLFKLIFSAFRIKNYLQFVPVISLVVFSLTQWENWLWGWQVQIFLNLFTVVTGLKILSLRKIKSSNLLKGMFLGIVATFSFANGLIYWIIGLIILKFKKQKNKNIILIFWSAFSILVFFLYTHLSPGSEALKANFSVQNIFLLTIYIFAFIGAPLVSMNGAGALVAGLTGVLFFIYLIIIARKLLLQKITLFMPIIALSSYSLMSAFLTSLGRYRLGLLQAISSRYVSFSNLFWLSLLAILFIIKENTFLSQRKQGKKTVKMAKILYFLIILAIFINSILRSRNFSKQYHYLAPARGALINGENDEMLGRLYHNIEELKLKREFLKKYKLNVF